MSIFEMEPIQKSEQLSFMPAPTYSQTVIDEALRIGANDRNSRLMIAAFFSKDKGIEANTAFLREHYGTNGAGFYYGSQQYAIWYDSDGIRLAPGNTVRSRMAMTISWETAASRIRELLDEGRYMDAEELSNVREYELRTLSNEFALAARDMTQEAREAGFAPTILAAIPGVFPESADNITSLITDPESLQTVLMEWAAVVEAYEQGQEIVRFRVPARRFLERLRDMQIEPLLFPADQNFRPEHRLFITEDEIENVLRGHSGDSEYRLGVYSFYRRNGYRKDREDYLKHLHGEYQGSYNGNDNLEYRTKGVMFAHGLIGNHTAEVSLSWNQAEKFVAAMISEDRFLSDADRLAMPDYERKRLAMTIHTAFYDLPDEIEKPFTGNPIGDYWENVREIQTRLENPAGTEEIYRMLQTVMDQTFPMERYHAERQKALTDLTAYRNGTYSLFGEVKTPAEIPDSPALEDDFSDIDPAEVKDQLAQAGIINGEVVDPDALAQNPFIQQVTADVEHITRDEEAPSYQVGDTVYLEGTAYEITEIGDYDVQLRDPAQSYPIFRSEPKERFERMLEQEPQESQPAAPVITSEPVSAYPSEETNLPYDIVVERLHIDEPEQVQEQAEPAPIIPAVNFRITDDELGCGTVRQKYSANIAAIRMLKTLEAENRNATPEEQEVLSRYVGWGGLQQAFDPNNSAWSTEYQELQELLEEYEYRDASESVLNAHYTSPTVIKAIYEAVGNLGFRSGNILEPSCGVGNFLGLLPKSMSYSRLYGVELDSITGRIARKLYPNADITVAGFEATNRSNFYDLAIGNIPFGNYRVSDRSYDSLGFSIHNYFFAKAIDQVRPGGIIAFVTSRYTMDSQNEDARKYIAERAELLGAIRLPNNAFLANAGTTVVSDILFLQKRERVIATEPDWIHLGETEDGITLNQYYVNHPEMILGELATRSTQYGRDECTVIPIPGADLGQQLHEAIQHIHGQYIEAVQEASIEEDTSLPADPDVRNFSFTVADGIIYYRENSRMRLVNLTEGNRNRVMAMIELRDCVRALISLESADAPEEDIIAQRLRLNDQYDAFQEKYGRINSRSNRLTFSDDDS